MDEDGAILASPSFAMALDWSRAFRTRALEEASSPFENRTTGVFRSMLAYCLDAVGRYEDACSFADATDEEDRSVYVRASVAACAFSEMVARLGRADAYFERAARHARASRLDSARAENLAFLRPAAQRFLAQTEDAALASYVRGLLDSDIDAGEASRLTEREADVMRCIAAGMTIAQAARDGEEAPGEHLRQAWRALQDAGGRPPARRRHRLVFSAALSAQSRRPYSLIYPRALPLCVMVPSPAAR